MQMVRVVFENDVKMYGTQAVSIVDTGVAMFENDVKMYGTQAIYSSDSSQAMFENDVKMYGTQAALCEFYEYRGLRMM